VIVVLEWAGVVVAAAVCLVTFGSFLVAFIVDPLAARLREDEDE
jgi:hypothetical protein